MGAKGVKGFRLINGIAAQLTSKQINELGNSTGLDIQAIFLDKMRSLPKDEVVKGTKGAAQSRAPRIPYVDQLLGVNIAHSAGFTGTGVKVAVIDTGVNFMPLDLGGGGGAPRSTCGSVDWTGEGYFDYNGHGTFVASEIASQGAQLYDFGGQIEGVAPGSTIIGEKVLLGAGYGWDSWIIRGIEDAIDCGANIISMSLGGEIVPNTGFDPVSEAISAAYDSGVLPVISAGNSGPGIGTVSTPGSSPYALTVGASTELSAFKNVLGDFYDRFLFHGNSVPALPDQMIGFSGVGPNALGFPKPNMVAPGYSVIGILCPTGTASATCSPGYNSETNPYGETLADSPSFTDWSIFSGTSMATPIVAGSAALVVQALKARFGGWDPGQVMDILASTAKNLGHDPLIQGAGRVNVGYAAKLAGGVPGTDGFIVDQSWAALEPGDTQTFTVKNLGTTAISGFKVTKVSLASAGSITKGSETVDTMGAPFDPICSCWTLDRYYDLNVPSNTQAIQADLVVHKSNTNGQIQAPQGNLVQLYIYDPSSHLVGLQRYPDREREGHLRLYIGSGSGTVDTKGVWIPGVLTTGHWTLKVHWEWYSNNFYRISYDFAVQKFRYVSFSAIASITPSSLSALPPLGTATFKIKAGSGTIGANAGFIVVSAPGILSGLGLAMIPVSVMVPIGPASGTGKSTFTTTTDFGRDQYFSEGDWKNYLFYVGNGVPNLKVIASWADPRTDVDIYLSSYNSIGEGEWSASWGILQAFSGEAGGTLTGTTSDFAYIAGCGYDILSMHGGPSAFVCPGPWMLTLHAYATSDTTPLSDKITVSIDRGTGGIAPSPTSIKATIKAGTSKTVKVTVRNNDYVHEDYDIFMLTPGGTSLSSYWTGSFSAVLDTFTGPDRNDYIFAIPYTSFFDSMALDVAVEWGTATVNMYDGSGGGIGTFITSFPWPGDVALAVYDQDFNLLGVSTGSGGGPIDVFTIPPMISTLPYPYAGLTGIVSANSATGWETPPGLPTNVVYEIIQPFTVTVTYYSNWLSKPSWVGTTVSLLSIDASKTGSFNFVASPPALTTPGTYIGIIFVFDDQRNLMMAEIPFTITVTS